MRKSKGPLALLSKISLIILCLRIDLTPNTVGDILLDLRKKDLGKKIRHNTIIKMNWERDAAERQNDLDLRLKQPWNKFFKSSLDRCLFKPSLSNLSTSWNTVFLQ